MAETKLDIKIDEELDLRGEVCPYTFVKSKLALELMEVGQILQVVVSNEESATNVPRSCLNEGHQVLAVEKLNDREWALVIQKQ